MGTQKPLIFRGYNSYNPYIGGVKPSNVMVLGSKGKWYHFTLPIISPYLGFYVDVSKDH